MVTLLLIALAIQDASPDERVRATVRAFETSRQIFEHELLGLGPDGLDAIGKLAREGVGDVRAVAERAERRIREDRKAIENAIAELGAAEPEKREAASRLLRDAGPIARWYLEKARRSTDAEIALRAEVLLARLNRGRSGAALRAGRLADAQLEALREAEARHKQGVASAVAVAEARLLFLHHSCRAGRLERPDYYRQKAAVLGPLVENQKRLHDAGQSSRSNMLAWALRGAYVERRLGNIAQEALEKIQSDALRVLAGHRDAGVMDRATYDRLALEMLTDPDEDLD